MSETRTGNLTVCARCGSTHELTVKGDSTDYRVGLFQYRSGDEVFGGVIRWQAEHVPER